MYRNSNHSPSDHLQGPLCGTHVLDLGTMIAGPLAATMFADFGADVLKVERPRTGDPLRNWTPQKDGESLWWKVTGRNKRLITLDLASPDSREILMRLLAWADVAFENFRPGTLEKWGLTEDVLKAANPRLVLVRVSGYGQTGPYRSKPGFGTVAEAMSGIPWFTGFEDGPPTLSAFPLADSTAAVFAAMAASFALIERERSGLGQMIDVSLYEPLFRLVESQVIGFDQLGLVKQRHGNRMEEDSPRNAYATRDGHWITISASSPRTFERLAAAIDRPDLSVDPKFADNAARVANTDELDGIIAKWFRDRSFTEAMEILERNDVVAGPVFDINMIFADPHYQARRDIVSVTDTDTGRTYRMPDVVPRFCRTPGAVVHPGLGLGRHNDEVYSDIVGLSAERIRELSSRGVI